MEVVKELQTKVSEVEQTVEKVKKVDEEKIQKKESQLQRVLRRESETRKSVDEQKSIIKNLAAIWKSRRIGQKYIRREDQQRNLELLQQAMKEDQLSKELYEVMSSMYNWQLCIQWTCSFKDWFKLRERLAFDTAHTQFGQKASGKFLEE